MRCLVQRVREASVTAEGELLGSIGRGLLLLLGVSASDHEKIADQMVQKVLAARIFEDANGKTNLSLADVGGQLLVVSQFTLYADCRRGNRPSFTGAGAPEHAEALYRYFLERCRAEAGSVEAGRFGADMKVRLLNDGPFTLLYDSEELGYR